ncbi:hypothetical protein ZWY2020_046237 [Hordeum vulgare]|nr:hypothetical protein ZWY2020_046237 [Hordeum vulgare]
MPGPLKRPSLGHLLATLRSPPRPVRLPTSSRPPRQEPCPPPRPISLPTASHALSPAETSVVVAGETLSLSPSPEPSSPVAVEPGSSARWPKRLPPARQPRLEAPWPSLIESACRRRSGPEELPDLGVRGPVSSIQEVEEAPRSSSCSDSDKSSEPSETRELVSGSEDPGTPKTKAKRSLRKILSKTLQKKKPKAKDASGSSDGELEQPEPTTTSEAFLILAPSKLYISTTIGAERADWYQDS